MYPKIRNSSPWLIRWQSSRAGSLALHTPLAIILCGWLSTPGQAAESQKLRDNVPVAVSRLAPVGSLKSSQRLRLAISLPLRNQPELAALLRQVYSPSSPDYRKFLNPAQFAERFGPAKQDYQALADFVRAHGFTVTGTHSNRTILDVEGAVSDIEKTFHLNMRVYRHPTEARQFYAPDTNPSVELPVALLHISGLDNYSLPRPNFKAKALAAKAAVAGNAGSGPNGTYAGYDFRAAYAPGASLTGSGQTVGLLEFDGYTTADITYYEKLEGLPNVPLTNVLLDGFTGSPEGGEVEVCLDIEMAISMAPGLSNVMVYEAGEAGSWHDILNRMATDDLAQQMSCSWYIPDGPADPVADQIFQQMAAQGQSFFSASGDDDAFPGLIPFPGDSPYITEVGGTTLTTTGPEGSWVSETVWNWGNEGDPGIGSGGGISTQYAIPEWQQGIAMTANQGSTTMRNVPDVAAIADNVYVRADGEDYEAGGTSCAAPIWAAFTALVNQKATINGKSVGFLNPALYTLAQESGYAGDFHDIATGNNFSPSSPAQFSAVTGYDLCTGLGTPAGNPLINALAGPQDSLEISFFSFNATGPQGGPFTPNTAAYTLINAGTSPMTWTVGVTQSWLTLSSTGGTLAVGGSTTVIVSLNSNASALGTGSYSDTITFTDLNSGVGQQRPASLIVPPQVPVLSVTPAGGFSIAGPPAGPFNPSSTTYIVKNTGGAPMSWGVGNTVSWLTVAPNGGTLASGESVSVTATVTSAANSLASGTYKESLAFSNLNNGEGSTPIPVTLLVWPPTPVITSTTNASTDEGFAFSYQITATNSPTSYVASGLPPGLILNTATGLISGSAAVSGTLSVTIGAANATGTGSANLTITSIPEAPVITFALPVITLSSFDGGNGAKPMAGLLQGSDGNFYGTTSGGGGDDDGAVFEMTSSGAMTILGSFDYSNGDEPVAGLVQGADGNFYGTTEYGGSNYDGTVFKITPSGVITTLWSFDDANGYDPAAALVLGKDGNFYGTTESGGSDYDGTVFRLTTSGSLTTLCSFDDSNGYEPKAGVVQGTDGNFYGTTEYGGSDDDGTIYKVSTAGELTALVSFNSSDGKEPMGGLVQGTDGNFYGTTAYGGPNGDGTVFRVTTGGSLTTLCSFTGTNGANPEAGLIQGSDGNFYGTTYAGGSSGDGTIFKVTTSGSLTTLCSFNETNGANPAAQLIQASDGNFYGTTSNGGSGGDGTVFELIPFGATVGSSFSYQVIASNTPSSYSATNLPAGLTINASTGLITGTPASSGTFTFTTSATNAGGTTNATMVLKIVMPPTPAITSLLNVTTPQGHLFAYQMLASGGPVTWQATGLPSWLRANIATGEIAGTPTVAGTYSAILTASNPSGPGSATLTITVTPSAPVITTPPGTLYSFNAGTGSSPAAGVIQGSDGNFYGATQSDGNSGAGTLFQLTSSGSCTNLDSLNWTADGAYPQGPLMEAGDGNLYGMAQSGGGSGEGVIFQLTMSGSLAALCSFDYTNGAEPMGGLVQGTDGNLYGTTEGGGSKGLGTVFQMTLSGSLVTLCSFTGSNGAQPMAGVVQGSDGNFYGTTFYGGSRNFGSLFKVTTSGSMTTLCSFTGTNGANPEANLIQGSNGDFYGTTFNGGSNNAGTVFKVTTSGSLTTLTTLCSFDDADGANPFGALFQGNDGNFYGTTSSGGDSDLGTIFQITPGGVLTTLYSFAGGIDGAKPLAGLVQGIDGSLYGTTSSGGANGNGTVFGITPLYFTGTTGQGFSYQITASNNPTGYSATGLPAGLTLDTASGLISGTAAGLGTNNVTISAINAGGTGSATLVITVLPLAPAIPGGLSATGTCNDPFQYQIQASNTPTGYGATGLPPGLTLSSTTGLISGVPTASGTSTVKITAMNSGGSGSAALLITVAPPSPAVTTGTVNGALYNAATLSGTVNPNGLDTLCYFNWGTSAEYGNTTVSQDIGSGSSPAPVTAELTGLTPDTIYFFQLVSINSSGTSYGINQTFTTAYPPPPTAITGTAINIVFNGATFTGSVNPNGFDTTVYFAYGPTTAYGSTTSSQDIGSGTASLAVLSPVTGLAALGGYHFCIVATNGGGTVQGADQTFSTPNGQPVAGNVEAYTPELKSVDIDVLAADSDPDGDSLTVTAVTQGLYGAAIINENSILTYIPGPNFKTTDQFTYTITDGYGATASASVTVHNGFISGQGHYSGIITGTTPLNENSGSLTASVTALGRYTAELMFAGLKYRLAGVLDGNMSNSMLIARPPQASLAVTLQLDPANRQITGQISTSGSNFPPFSAAQSSYDARHNPAPQKGKYTAVLLPDPAEDGSSCPQGNGYLFITVSAGGSVTATGKLGDGTNVSTTGLIVSGSCCPIYIPLYGSNYPYAGSIFGDLIFQGSATASAWNGTLYWFKPPPKAGQPYAGGFETQVTVQGSGYQAALSGHRSLDFSSIAGDGVFTANDGGLASPFVESVTLSPSDVIAPSAGATNSLRLTIASNTGALNGSFVPPGGKLPLRLFGIVNQNENTASGLFLSGTRTGAFSITGTPEPLTPGANSVTEEKPATAIK